MEPLSDDINLSGLPFMPLDVLRLADSDFVAIATGDEFKAAVLLWCKSWHQVPAGSLPNDDRVLAHLSGAGKDWKKISAVALRGWTLASDGRLYHPVIVEKALAAFDAREAYRDKRQKDADRIRRWRDKSKPETPNEARNETPDETHDEARNETPMKRVTSALRNADETRKRERGRETGTEEDNSARLVPDDETPMKRVSRSAEIAVFLKAENVFGVNPHHATVMAWAGAGVTDNELRSALSMARARKGPNARIALGYIDGIIRSEREANTPKLTGANKHGNFNERDYKRDETPDSQIGWLPHAENG